MSTLQVYTDCHAQHNSIFAQCGISMRVHQYKLYTPYKQILYAHGTKHVRILRGRSRGRVLKTM